MEICKNDGLDAEHKCNGLLRSIDDAFYAIGGKWKLKILVALGHDNKRFNEIQRAVKGISARILSNELKELERNGIVKRKVDADAFPVMVIYELTPYSLTLNDVVNSLSQWGMGHREFVKTAN